jgi:glycosyltransferase involved in cell wall biosynthesis
VKGLTHVIEAFTNRPPARPTTLVTVDGRGLLEELKREYRIIDLGWVDDEATYPLAFAACDVFLMPSLAEGFGLMALEAMASARPVICFEGTSVPSVTHAPECGIAVPMGDAVALRDAVDHLASNPEEAHRRGRLGRKLATSTYSHDAYLDTLASLYLEVAARARS